MRKVQIFFKNLSKKKSYDLDLLPPSYITFYVVGHFEHLHHDIMGVLVSLICIIFPKFNILKVIHILNYLSQFCFP